MRIFRRKKGGDAYDISEIRDVKLILQTIGDIEKILNDDSYGGN